MTRIKEVRYITRSEIYDELEEKYYGMNALIEVDKSFVENVVKDYFEIIFRLLKERCVITITGFGSFKLKKDKKTVTSNTVWFRASGATDKKMVDSTLDEVSLEDIINSLANKLLGENKSSRVPRRFLVELVTQLPDEVINPLLEGHKVCIKGFGEFYGFTDDCVIFKQHITRKRTRALFEPSAQLYNAVNQKEDH